jgi:hypothetical protein
MNSPQLQTRLEEVLDRERRLKFWSALARVWAGAALAGLFVIFLERSSGWSSSLLPWLVALLALVLAFRFTRRNEIQENDWRQLARRVESHHPELDGRLLTAVQQNFQNGGTYLQQRLLAEVLRHAQTSDWTQAVPAPRLKLAKTANWLALLLFIIVLADMRHTSGPVLLTHGFGPGSITVTPGDISLERGNSLVVLARFSGALPATVELVLTPSVSSSQRITLVKSLADPMFGGSVPEVSSNLAYHVEYGGQRTRDFHVTVFEYPRLEKANADLKFPDYTGLAPKRIENTRRVTAVEGSQLNLTLELNKPVVSARLVAKDQNTLPLTATTNRPAALLKDFPLQTSKTYELQLTDAEGRTNKTQTFFVFEALTNRTPELRLTSPRGDLRPSPIEEISFDGTVWDDFGVKAFGLGYSIAGQDPKLLELGRDVPGNEKRSFHHFLRLEDLAVQPDQLLSWFVWADDIGPDGQLRHTTGDIFFGEVRPFEEVFREGQGGDQQDQGESQSGQHGSQAGRLSELQKQIISATWRLQRDHPVKGQKPDTGSPATKTRSSEKAAPSSTSSGKSQSPSRSVEQASTAPSGFGSLSINTPLQRGVAATLANGNRFNGFSRFFGQAVSAEQPAFPRAAATPRSHAPGTNGPPTYQSDITVVRDSQAQALDQAHTAIEDQRDPRAASLWSAAAKQMETALERLNRASNSPASLPDALAAEQAAYQALLKLREHEYQVSRSRNRNQRGQSDQMRQQLEQLDLAQSENRYETTRQAQRPQNNQRREQLQVMNRLQELARRQQDLNDRLKELQTALQEARTEQERQEIQRRLKRLQEEEQQMLADVDELRQRMDQPENQSSMAEQRRQLDQTRDDVQRAEQSASQGSAAQALASGTRAQRQFQQLHDQMRKENSSQFADDLREMRNQARELAHRQDELSSQIDSEANTQRQSLSDAPEHQAALSQLAQQARQLTNLLDRATQVSQQADVAEPLLSRQLYDTVRKFMQETGKNLQESQDQLLERGLMTRDLYDQLKESSIPDGAKLLDLTSNLLGRNLLPQAKEASQRIGTGISGLKNGVEQAAESILGDDAEAMRLAQQELDRLTEQLRNEAAGATNASAGGLAAGQNGSASNRLARARSRASTNENGQQGQNGNQEQANSGQTPQSASGATPDNNSANGDQSGSTQRGGNANRSGAATGATDSASSDSSGSPGGQPNSNVATPRDGVAQDATGARGSNIGGSSAYGGGDGENSAAVGRAFDRLFDEQGNPLGGPLTGDNFLQWSDRLRDVEEMLDAPDLRTVVAAARDRARLLRQAYRRDQKKPDWAVVKLQVFDPLVQVRNQIAEELARRESKEALVPIDRDPVPDRYSELVRKYYENLGRAK